MDMYYNDVVTRVDETSIANKELIQSPDYVSGFDFLSDLDATLIFWDREHKVKGGTTFSIPVSGSTMIRSLKIKESGIVFTLYAATVFGKR